jgi:hypothetical protein
VSDVVVRLAVVAVVIVVAAVIAFVIGRLARPPHPGISVGDVGDRPGVILFTSTTCSTCKETIAMYQHLGVPFREVTNELEPQRFEEWGVVAVPLTVVVDAGGTAVRTFSGLPRKASLVAALSAAGIPRATS